MNQGPLKKIETLKLTLTRGEPLTRRFAPTNFVEIARAFLGEPDREHFGVMTLDADEEVTACHLVSVGTPTKTLVHARETFKAAILSNAVSLILFHNHMGDPTPSLEDLRVTQKLRQSGELLGIPITNHVILGSSSGILMKEAGYFELEIDEDGQIRRGDVDLEVNEDGHVRRDDGRFLQEDGQFVSMEDDK